MVKIPSVTSDCSRTSATATSAEARCHRELANPDISVYWDSPSNQPLCLEMLKSIVQTLLPFHHWCNPGSITLEPSRRSHPSASLFTAKKLWTGRNFHTFHYINHAYWKEPFLKTSMLYSPEASIFAIKVHEIYIEFSLLSATDKLTQHLQKQGCKHQAQIWIVLLRLLFFSWQASNKIQARVSHQ